jgi:hypothetical protein
MREYFTLSVRTWKMKKFTFMKFLDRNGYFKLSRGEHLIFDFWVVPHILLCGNQRFGGNSSLSHLL